MADVGSPNPRSRRQYEVPTRSAGYCTASSSKSPSRETSEILSRMVVSQPEVDVAREQERLAEAIPHPVNRIDDAASPQPVPMNSTHEDARRGGRSRHDHSKRDKAQKFGDYFLGRTIGEGEFGKVKLGWKQQGGVQVDIS